ncbi:CDK5 and ABL1 enzyme substrate 2 [Neophocaena asiaeorientalis asiaeorientalis]|uniref:CDK5 and ABL1 enzyme substrate 2 n=1 Tax=Neophocaena asiaeorientalis asiaeorientalis TaxID=1706337 RepID=A0A341BT80_NEOAA|nr:CDK5 and ABL1 enzyme substrate 2 [Neophocaena asiaeorientalis asiaeorientalis]
MMILASRSLGGALQARAVSAPPPNTCTEERNACAVYGSTEEHSQLRGQTTRQVPVSNRREAPALTQGRFAADGRAGLCLGLKAQHRPPACHPRQVPSPLGLAVSSSVTGGGQGAPLAIPGAPGGWYSSSARTSDPRPRKDTHPKRGSALEPKDEALRTLTTNATAQQVEQSTGAPGPRLPSPGQHVVSVGILSRFQSGECLGVSSSQGHVGDRGGPASGLLRGCLLGRPASSGFGKGAAYGRGRAPVPVLGRVSPRLPGGPRRVPIPAGLSASLGPRGQLLWGGRRRIGSQRCSLEFLEDTVGCASVQRTKHTSGSPRHKGLKKTHFIKNMRQYDTKNSRIVLICAKRSLCAAFSVLPYGEGLRVSDLRVDSQKQRHPSGGVSVSSEMVFQLEGVELGADGKVVSYAKFLYPTNALVTLKPDSHGPPPQPRPSAPRALLGPRCKPIPPRAAPAGSELGADTGDALEYNPDLLDDPQWPCGKHKRVLIFASYMTTVIEYVKPSDLKKDMNETFREKFPHIKLTLSKIRSLKREMWNLSEECGLEPVTVSMAYVYFEKLVLQGKVNKQNRKLCAGACVLLAAKISSDLRKNDVKQLIDKLEEKFRFNRRDLIGFEFTVLVALELALYLPENQVLPHYRRLTQQF